MSENFTRKDRRFKRKKANRWNPYLDYGTKCPHVATGHYKELKKQTARKNRRRPITDETPYKRLEDPWAYC